ncbi:zinc ABC transporter substrate-binding protein [Paenarthrobacter sp. Z7-10]|uniref:metal ABC transporter solute-binding protein, Zn/Mn family n=1 Tax=Paenarthrobacter sp. Z7-10 TaxID=2787635 RepID=UPI0022A9E3B3|nr:zinc ABC transporter substrate-binding protein [Paenarthrobacter sp. Z7-10]MCZ2402440.1 zinc ABC transporter substrate-binding protein [Paenarthrobacter sp. Z7-10]
MRHRRYSPPLPVPPALAMALAMLSVLMLSGCGTDAAPGAAAGTPAPARISVVASTNVYGDIAARIGGDKVTVRSIIDLPSQDPHSYQATAQDKLAVSKAQLGIENGGGYDDFFDQLAAGGTLPAERILNVARLSGLETDATRDSFNEHVWYFMPTVARLADAIASRLGELDPSSAPSFRVNADAFKASTQRISAKLAALKAAHGTEPVAITEPVPLYLLQAAGLVNQTPPAYSHAVEQGTDVPASVLKETTDLLRNKKVKFLAYNDQTEGPQTRALRDAATAAGIPVVSFSETLPQDLDYLAWMNANADHIGQALTTSPAP